MTRRHLEVDISPQPDDWTCGPASLHAVYRYFGDGVSLGEVVDEVHALDGGGTLGALLATHALKRGYSATLYSYNLAIFDPTWFELERDPLIEKLRHRAEFKKEPRLTVAIDAYIEFLEHGGELRFADLSPRLLRDMLDQEQPVLTGLSATYLYRTPREFGPEEDWDDVRGDPSGHFVVLSGYEKGARRVWVADPLQPNPLADNGVYKIGVDRLITAVLLGVLTYDANFLQIAPPDPGRRAS